MLSRNNLFWFALIWINAMWVIPMLDLVFRILTWPFRVLG